MTIANRIRQAGVLVLLVTSLASAEGRDLTVEGRTGTITVADVVVGDVWVSLGGYSDMISLVRGFRPDPKRPNQLDLQACTREDLAGGRPPVIRILKAGSRWPKGNHSIRPRAEFRSTPGDWSVYTPQGSWCYFEPVSYFFGRICRRRLKVPVGSWRVRNSRAGRFDPTTTGP